MAGGRVEGALRAAESLEDWLRMYAVVLAEQPDCFPVLLANGAYAAARELGRRCA